jgi:IS605 OrfB family transposase
MSETTRTYQTLIRSSCNEPLSDYANLMAHVEHCLFADFSRGKKPIDLKSSYISKFGITARQFNAVSVSLDGKISSIKELKLFHIEQKKEQIVALLDYLPGLKNPKVIHEKKRRLATLRYKLKKLEKERDEKTVSLCFGSKQLFCKQFHLEKNGYKTHADWKHDWQKARSNQIFFLGSKDETGGNQTCTASLAEDGSISLRVRLPDSLSEKHGKYLFIPNLFFAYGHEELTAAIRNCKLRKELSLMKDSSFKNYGQAITFRFKKGLKGWYVLATTNINPPSLITDKEKGAIGVDINSDHLAVTELDRFGNAITTYTFPFPYKNATNNQMRAAIGDASKQIIELCETTQKPLILEDLDFQKKKAQLKEKNHSYARMLSAFAYQSIITHLKSRGASKGIGVYSISPAFTSLIGRVNYAERYGLSIHHAAALCIGRRYLGLSEKMPKGRRKIPDGKGGHVTLDLPVRNRSRHVWKQWGQLNKKCSAALTARFRTVKADPRARQNIS